MLSDAIRIPPGALPRHAEGYTAALLAERAPYWAELEQELAASVPPGLAIFWL